MNDQRLKIRSKNILIGILFATVAAVAGLWVLLPAIVNTNEIKTKRYTGLTAMKIATLTILVVVFMYGCPKIWNASDLAVWVKDRAVEQGCQRETIELEEWYTETAEGNVWRGTCRETRGNTKLFEINIDPVWKPSAGQPARFSPVMKTDKSRKMPP